jgi:two-component system response regulator MprA
VAGSRAVLLLAAGDLQPWPELLQALRPLGCACAASASLSAADLQTVPFPYHLAVVLGSAGDRALPEFCRQLRAAHVELPVLALLADGAVLLRVAALEAGADVALSLPVAADELAAYLRALLRRSISPLRLSHRDLSLDPTSREVQRAGQSIRLTVKEFDLLAYLLQHRQQVLPRQQILKAVWGETWVGDDNLLDVYIRYLRKKIERPDLEPLIHTVRGVGFQLK